jgi:predicted outer membrane repeat protein
MIFPWGAVQTLEYAGICGIMAPEGGTDMERLISISSLGILVLATVCLGNTWYITPDGTGDAPTIQAGVDSASAGDTVLVACGTYYGCPYVEPSGSRASIRMKSGLTLRSETGDPTCAVIDAQQEGRVMICDSVLGSGVQGFTFKGGLAPDGGGAIFLDSDLTLDNVVFTGNSAETDRGGAVRIFWGSGVAPVFRNCVFSGNTAANYGGAIYLRGVMPEVMFDRCVFENNSSPLDGGAVCCIGSIDRVDFQDCWFEDNSSSMGGGVSWLNGGAGVFERCVFLRNSASCGAVPGGAAIEQDDGTIVVHGCTLYGNMCDAISLSGWCDISISNTIIASSSGCAVSMFSDDEDVPYAWVECSDFYENATNNWCPGTSMYRDINGNMSECPSFCDAEAGDFHLCDESPCTPEHHPGEYACDLIGAFDVGCACGPSSTRPTTWGGIKAIYSD